MTTTYTETQMIRIGGRLWEGRNGTRRVYLNDWTPLVGLEIEHYKSGNICHATLDGEEISNSRAYKLLSNTRVYWQDGAIYTNIRETAEYARLDGNAMVERLLAGIADAVAGTELTTRQAAERLGVSVRTVQRRCQQGKLAARKNERGRWVITL